MIRLFSILCIVLFVLMQNSFSLDFKQFEIKRDYTVGKTPLIIFPTANYESLQLHRAE